MHLARLPPRAEGNSLRVGRVQGKLTARRPHPRGSARADGSWDAALRGVWGGARPQRPQPLARAPNAVLGFFWPATATARGGRRRAALIAIQQRCRRAPSSARAPSNIRKFATCASEGPLKDQRARDASAAQASGTAASPKATVSRATCLARGGQSARPPPPPPGSPTWRNGMGRGLAAATAKGSD